jgi:hypothetical protein
VLSEADLACSQVTTMERLLHQTLASVHGNILHPVQVSLRKKSEKSFLYPQQLPLCLLALFFLCVLFLQVLSQGNTDATILREEVARA